MGLDGNSVIRLSEERPYRLPAATCPTLHSHLRRATAPLLHIPADACSRVCF